MYLQPTLGRPRAPAEAIPRALFVLLAMLLGAGAVRAPSLALAAALALAFLALAARKVAIALAIFVALTFFDRTTALQSLGLTTPVKLVGGVVAMAWLLISLRRAMPFRQLATDQRAFALIALGFVGWSLASALWAQSSSEAVSSTVRLALGVSLLFIVYSVLMERRHLWWFLSAFIAGSVFAVILGSFGTYAASASVNDARLSGGFDDPNELAAVLVPALVFSSFAFLALRGRWLRWAFALVLPIAGVALLRTDSQAGLLALGLALILSIVFGGQVRRHAVVVVGCVVALGTIYYTVVTEPVAFQTIGSQGNVGSRETLWAVGLDVVADHPVAGVGAGNFTVVEPSYTLEDINLPRADLVLRPELVHNTYLQVFAELGAIGLALFFAIIAGSLWLGVRAVRLFEASGNRELGLLARSAVIGTASILLAFFFATNQYEKQLWLLLALGPAFHAVALRMAAGAVAEPIPSWFEEPARLVPAGRP